MEAEWSDIIDRSVSFYFTLKKQEASVVPEDGLAYALEEMGKEGFSQDDYHRCLKKVQVRCLSEEISQNPKVASQYPYEMLDEEELRLAYTNFRKCESEWLPVTTDTAKSALRIAHSVLEQTGAPANETALYEWTVAKSIMEQGHALRLPTQFIRLRTNLEKCPFCGSSIPKHTAALSRLDNSTRICADCGMREALTDYFHNRSEEEASEDKD